MDYGGHDSEFAGNLVLAIPYDGQQCVNLGDFVPGHQHKATGNKCVVGLGLKFQGSGCGDPTCASSEDTPANLERVVSLAECSGAGAALLANNSYFTVRFDVDRLT